MKQKYLKVTNFYEDAVFLIPISDIKSVRYMDTKDYSIIDTWSNEYKVPFHVKEKREYLESKLAKYIL